MRMEIVLSILILAGCNAKPEAPDVPPVPRPRTETLTPHALSSAIAVQDVAPEIEVMQAVLRCPFEVNYRYRCTFRTTRTRPALAA